MAKCNRDTHPKLFGYLEAYGLDNINRIDRIKENGHYCVVGWVSPTGLIEMLDLAKSPDTFQKDYRNGSSMAEYGYNMCNDSCGAVAPKDWDKIKLDTHCDTFTIPGNEDYS